jgi:cell wall-associated NlpC family hydrolase
MGKLTGMKTYLRFNVALAVISMSVVLAGCGSAPPRPDVSVAPVTGVIDSRLSHEQANDVTIYAVGLVGTPYRYGGNTPSSGFDCSGLIGHVYQSRAGVLSPRTVAKLTDWGKVVPSDQIRSGDLVLFGSGAGATHAGIYVGSGRFVHAPSTGGEVRLDRLSAKHWAAQQVSFRRP